MTQTIAPTENDQNKPADRAQVIRLTVQVVFVYFLVIVFLIVCMLFGDMPAPYPKTWTGLMDFVYYFLPYLLALWAGVMLRPFWPSFRNVFVGIIVVHLFYSFGIYMGHAYHWDRLEQQTRRYRSEKIKILTVDHQFLKNSQDDSAVQLLVRLQFDSAELSSGDYRMTAELWQRGLAVPQAQFDFYDFRIGEKGGQVFQTVLSAELQNFNKDTAGDPYDINLRIQRKILIDESIKNFLFWARWAAFFRTADWEGRDTELTDRWVETHVLRKIDSVPWPPRMGK
ncbi:MAG: hypothetical protein A2787_03505 [Omnitrophica WOR_2 bacterium RIFCSPHIGHO2_01_FULL_48_9]|nr:MAG: hypothetical protein A2787_03505 [Omnitrophica WOR_2 bacterium RIFCSPHIGHO2_01_FULL_48_9]